jgi:hypothetical protein
MVTAPKEYLSLVAGATAYFSQYTAGGTPPGIPVRTSYTKVRLDPTTLKVNIAVQSFATSNGSLVHSSGFEVGGHVPSGNSSPSSNNQIVVLTGGGFCGWNAPARLFNPFNQVGGFDLPLEFLVPAYAWTGFFQPVDNAPTFNSVKAGSSVPVRFGLGGNHGLNIFAAGYPKLVPTPCPGAGAALDDIEQTVTAGGSGLSYDPTSTQYTSVWKTEQGWAGKCGQLVVRLNDLTETDHVANFV